MKEHNKAKDKNEKKVRKAEASWEGNLEGGHGLVSTESRVLTESKFSFQQRVEGEGKDTNPEELIAASAASCFAMALSKILQDEGTVATKLKVRADVSLNLDDGPKLNEMTLHVEGLIPDYSEDALESAVAKTAENCPVVRTRVPVNTYIGVPRGRDEIEDENLLVLYSSADNVAELSSRRDKPEGKAKHRESVKEHEEKLKEQDKAVEESRGLIFLARKVTRRNR